MHFPNVCVYSSAERTEISRPVVTENSAMKDNYGIHEYFIIRLTENAFLCVC